VYIFEGSDSETKSATSAGKVSVPSPIGNHSHIAVAQVFLCDRCMHDFFHKGLDLKQTVILRLEGMYVCMYVCMYVFRIEWQDYFLHECMYVYMTQAIHISSVS
jgi:hypothetical protein